MELFKYGDWTIIKDLGTIKYRRYILCECICGNQKNILYCNIKRGLSKGCGCKKKYRMSDSLKKHGMSRTIEYNTYKKIINRCNNKNDKSYENYGGRGIKNLWNNFECFFKDMGEKPGIGYSIGRIDNEGHYCKENCRRENAQQQSENKRSTIYYNGKCLKSLCKELGLKYKTVYARFKYYGWSIQEALCL